MVYCVHAHACTNYDIGIPTCDKETVGYKDRKCICMYT